MSLDPNLMALIVCPQCKGAVTSVDAGSALTCERCKLKFPVRDGIPLLLVEEAHDLRHGARVGEASSVKLPRVSFRVTDGPDSNMTFQIEQGSCRAIGRASVDTTKTEIFNVDISLALDENTRGLVLQYVAKQFGRGAKNPQAVSGERFGQFKRAPDIVLTDTSLSRLHAMIFSDEKSVSVLDLVSKNGTFVNGKEVESRMIKRGDSIEMGETTIVFEG